jgi:hypothetical protein
MRQVDLVKAVRLMLKEWREQLGARWGAVTLFVASATTKGGLTPSGGRPAPPGG